MVAWLYVGVGIAFLALLAAVIWLLIIIFREKEADSDSTICLNFMANIDNGKALGVERSVTPGKNGRLIIEYDAKDVDLNRVAKTGESTIAKVIVPKNKIISLAKGTFSKDRNFNFLLPAEPEDLHPAIRDTPLGKGLMVASELKNFEMMVEKVLREGSDRKDELLKKIGDGEISKEFMSYFSGMVKDFMDNTVNLKLKEKANATLTTALPGQYQQ